MPVDEVLRLLATDPDRGLDVFEVRRRQERFGPNVLTEAKEHGPLVRFLLQFHQPLIYILLAAALITASLQEWVDSAVIFGVVLVNAVVGFLEEAKALGAIEALARTMTSEATVLRAGQKRRIAATELVPGDVVLLRSGDKVPADMRLIHTRELQIDESALTGESVPVPKGSETLDPETMLPDRRNMAYSSTLATYGTGTGVVVATGEDTEIGRISHLISSAEVLETPLTRKIARFSRVLLYVILAIAAATFFAGTLRGESWVDMFMAAVALAVGAIPEGLPAAVTITLAIGVAKMARRHAIVRKLPAVETLGSTTVICADKTGTLTQNQMTVQRVMAANETFEVSGIGYTPHGTFQRGGEVVDPRAEPALLECLRAGLLCNDATLLHTSEGWRVDGDPTEGALLVAAAKARLTAAQVASEFPRIDTLPFESQHQYMATLHDAGRERARLVYVKGSVEAILARCGTELGPTGEIRPLRFEAVQHGAEQMAAAGLRVLALARGNMPPGASSITHADVAGGLTFLGLQGMLDPPRPEAVRAVRACRGAGIQVKMITGDHPATAAAIARKLGLDGDRVPVALTGQEIAQLADAGLIDRVERTLVFARVTPEQKLRLVEALQARGHVVAMTGDGVNDAPALRRADIGIAMGLAGTEVAKEAADMVLADDNFSSIEAAVEEGRGVFDNLTKFITWTLPTNIGEGLVIMAAVIAGVPLPILPVQILWINMTTAVLLGLTLAFEPKEPGIMERPPRNPRAPILTGALVFRIWSVGALLLAGSFGLFHWALANGASRDAARTVAVNVFVMGELFYLFNCRSLTHSMFALGLLSNRWLLGGVTSMVLLQFLFTYTPAMNRMFQSAPIGLGSWVWILSVGIAVYGFVGLEKSLRRCSLRHLQLDRTTPGSG